MGVVSLKGYSSCDELAGVYEPCEAGQPPRGLGSQVEGSQILPGTYMGQGKGAVRYCQGQVGSQLSNAKWRRIVSDASSGREARGSQELPG
jgi:hypothetical protein